MDEVRSIPCIYKTDYVNFDELHAYFTEKNNSSPDSS